MQCNFQVGQKVVCVLATRSVVNDQGFPRFRPGQILTISGMEMTDGYGVLDQPELFLRFAERPSQQWAHHSGFRPLVTRKTDISCFTKLLQPSKQAEPA